jgi:fructose-bisphosphate aldolase class II
MLVSLNEVMPLLNARKVCLPAFDIGGGQGDFLRGVLAACEAARAPALLLVWSPGTDTTGLEACADLVRSFAGRASVPVILHLDHGRDEGEVQAALAAGFKSVMFDGSACPLDENIRRTKQMAALAHEHAATIEGELGSFDQARGAGGGPADLADPDEAVRFVEQTKVDVLAPAVGNAHGFYKRPPRLRFDLIEAIASRTGVPLALHGGTGLPAADIRRSAALGVRKLNIATQLHKDFSDALCAAVVDAGGRCGWHKALAAGREAVSATAARYLSELGAGGLV